MFGLSGLQVETDEVAGRYQFRHSEHPTVSTKGRLLDPVHRL
jgi:hypothetical protein